MKNVIVIIILLLSLGSISAKNYTFYALSFDKNNSEAIYLVEFNGKTGEMTVKNRFGGAYTANYFALSNNKKTLLLSNNSPTKKKAGVTQFSIAKDGSLTKVSDQFKPGGMPCYVSFTKNNSYVLSADYGDDEISLYAFKNGKLSDEVDNIVFKDMARGHYIVQDPSGKNIHAVFLGLDQVRNYTINNGKFVVNPNQEFFQLPKGEGPRHMVFHEKKPFVYVLNEVGSSVTAASYDKDKGTLTFLQKISMLPNDFNEFSKAAAIRIHPNGKFLYASNRGHNSIAVFKIKKDGTLDRIQIQGEGIDFPRDFIITPDGKWMIIGNKNAGSVISYSVDKKTGMLSPTGYSFQIPQPLAFVILK